MINATVSSSYFILEVENLSDSFEGLTDEEPMNIYKEGQVEALGFLIKRLRVKMDQVARTKILDRELANDALQEACATIFRTATSYRGESKVFTWVYRIVVNACIDQLRKERTRSSLNVSDEALEMLPQEDFSNKSNSEMVIKDALNKLPSEQRQAVTLVWIEGYTVEETSRILEIPLGTVKSRCDRGKKALAEILKDLRPRVEPNASSERLKEGGK
jgi:RNA polymerase sigma-70 factor (ECF subfamily)